MNIDHKLVESSINQCDIPARYKKDIIDELNRYQTDTGITFRLKVTDFNVGDIFGSENSSSSPVAIMKIYPLSVEKEDEIYFFTGLNGNYLFPFGYATGYPHRLWTKKEVLKYLNEYNLVRIGGVNVSMF